MSKKFKFLTKQSINKKIGTKSFKIINVILCLIVICLVNINSIIDFFGGKFNDPIKIYVVDDVGLYDDFETNMSNNIFDLFSKYHAELTLADKSVDELKDDIIKDETGDIVVHFKNVNEMSLDNLFTVDIISYEYIDSVLYQKIGNSINSLKREMALNMANISDELLSSIEKDVSIERVLLDENLNKNDELMELIGAILIIVLILPIFMLILSVTQMIGAEINEEKTSKSMEVIISSVSPKTHFMSKLISANIFAIIQGLLLVGYVIIGSFIKVTFTGTTDLTESLGQIIAIDDSIDMSGIQITEMLTESNIISNIAQGIPVFILLIVLTFIAYTLFIGILASITTSMEDFNQIQTPVMMLLMASYFLAIYGSLFQGSDFIKIMTFVPFISGILSPVMYVLGEITLFEMGISVVLISIVIFLLYKYGLKIYKVGILNYSSSNLWKKMYKALKS